MIKLLRVDHRLLHGQVAFSWTQFLGADCILIANDSLMQDELRKTTIKLAKPQGVKVVMKNIQDSIDAINSGVTDKYKLFVVVESIEDATYINHKDGNSISLKDKITTEKDEEEIITNKIAINELIKGLKKREQEVILLRFYKEKTQAQVAKILGITQVQVSRIERKILSNMKLKLSS